MLGWTTIRIFFCPPPFQPSQCWEEIVGVMLLCSMLEINDVVLYCIVYKRARNNVTEMIKLSKKQYYENSMQESRHNPTKMWKVLKQLTHGNNRESLPNTHTADIFNSYFTNIGLDTVSHLQPTPITVVDGGENDLFWRGSSSTCCFDFTTIEQDPVKKKLLKFGDVTHNDVLGFDSRMLFLSADIIAHILTKCYNVSVETETVISDWKLSKVTPIYKGKVSKDEAGNYRPISLISHIMKIFEKEIKLQVMEYLEVNNRITSDQSAYRNQHNTQTALHRVVDDWLDNVSDGNLRCVFF